MDNKLLVELMTRDNISRDDAIEMCMSEYEETGMDAEESLYNLGFEPDFIFDFFDIVARH